MSAETAPVPFIPPPPYTPEPRYVWPGSIPMTVEEYLAWEPTVETRYEYADGYAIPKHGVEELEDGTVRAMSGEEPEHNRIAINVCGHIDRAFGERECQVYIENVRTRVSPTQYRYPDVVALCGEARFDNIRPPALLNPAVIVEVLSPSTESVDRGVKFLEYRQVSTVTDYVLITRDRPLVEHYARQRAGAWTFREYTALTDTLTFASIDVAITLADIYRRIVFASASPPATTASGIPEGASNGNNAETADGSV